MVVDVRIVVLVFTARAVAFFLVFEVVNPVDFVFESKAYDVDDAQNPTAEEHKQDSKYDAEHVFVFHALCETIKVCGDIPKQAKQNFHDFVEAFIPRSIFFVKSSIVCTSDLFFADNVVALVVQHVKLLLNHYVFRDIILFNIYNIYAHTRIEADNGL